MKIIDQPHDMMLYLSDESRRIGKAEQIFFPDSAREIRQILLSNPESSVTIQGGRTGVTAGAVPAGGIVINLSSMDRILNASERAAMVQPGLLLCRLQQQLKQQKLMFLPDPTETTASIGGMVSCNSSGARSYRHGATRKHILELEMVLADGDTLRIRRGEQYAKDGAFSLTTGSGRVIRGRLPSIRMPQVKKHTAGYYINPDMDMIDLFIGSEGTLGIVTQIELSLHPQPAERWGTVIFFEEEQDAVCFVRLLRDEKSLQPEAIEFFGSDTTAMLRGAQDAGSILADMPAIPSGCAIYTEFTSESKDILETVSFRLGKLILEAGGDPARSWFAFQGPDMERLKDFRHAAPVCVNEEISAIRKRIPEITKLGTDMSVPDECLQQVFEMYRKDLAREGFRTSLFGHIGNNHLHCNIIPGSLEEYNRGKALYSHWADEVAAMGGSVSAEHGIGKLKPWLLRRLYSEEELRSMQELKKLFDPDLRLNPGNIFGI